MSRIELLAPAGNDEALITAVESGCNAVYLGLNNFNARDRAKNFQVEYLPEIIKFCHKRNVKVFVTLNTLIKNSELLDLIKLLYQVVSCRPDAIIIQDLALFYLLQKMDYTHIHFSTQAGIHNSLGVKFAMQKGAERAILAREMTLLEIEKAAQAGEVEIFIHGALCYSLSGSCLFSSYLGGMSANRGKCKQPCRRNFNLTKRKKDHLFSLKDFELIDFIPQLEKTGVKSLKIEGRMKRADYVSKVVKAYRLVLDNPANLTQAKELLNEDFGRAKTAYFVGANVSESITNQPFAGIYLGEAKVRANTLFFTQDSQSSLGDKIKLYYGEEDSQTFTITEIKSAREVTISEYIPNAERVSVYKVSGQDLKVDKLNLNKTYLPNISKTKIREILGGNQIRKEMKSQTTLYVRLASIADSSFLPKLKEKVRLIIPLQEFDNSLKFIDKDIIWELPLFIAENELITIEKNIQSLWELGYRNFAISHISQLNLLPEKANVLANENIYTLNDIAIKQIQDWGVEFFILPFENDIPNLNHYQNSQGILAIFFTPALFSSRMPVKQGIIKDTKNEYILARKGRLSITYPQNPVCIFSFKKKLSKFKNYFLDLSTPNISTNDFREIFAYYVKEENVPNSTKFNFKKGLW